MFFQMVTPQFYRDMLGQSEEEEKIIINLTRIIQLFETLAKLFRELFSGRKPVLV